LSGNESQDKWELVYIKLLLDYHNGNEAWTIIETDERRLSSADQQKCYLWDL